MATFISIWGLGIKNILLINMLLVTFTYQPKIPKKLIKAYIYWEIYLIEDLKANILVETDIITLKYFILILNKKTAFIRSCFCIFDINIEIPCYFYQYLKYTKLEVTILSQIKQNISIYYLSISHLRDFFF